VFNTVHAKASVSSKELSSLKTVKWIWTGYGFETIENVILTSQSNDISLIPYVYTQNVLDTSEGKLCCKTGCTLPTRLEYMGSSRSTGLQNVCDPLNHGNDAGNESLLLLGLMKSTLDS
jgi:hypothetical protein